MKLFTKNMSWTILRDIIKRREDFKNNGKTFWGRIQGPYLSWGHWLTNEEAKRYNEWQDNDEIEYVILSFQTPIFVLHKERGWIELEHVYGSKTTTSHRNKARVAIGEL